MSVMPISPEVFPGADIITKRLEGSDFMICMAFMTFSESDKELPLNFETVRLLIIPHPKYNYPSIRIKYKYKNQNIREEFKTFTQTCAIID